MNEIKDYAPLFSAIIASMALIFSLFSFIVSNLISASRAKNEKKTAESRYNEQKEQYEERMRLDRERYLEQQRHMEEKERKSEEPYLVYKESGISKIVPSDASSQIIIEVSFLNKGRGAAYSIVPQLNYEAKGLDGNDYIITRYEPVQDPIALQGEYFKTQISYVNNKKMCLMTTIVINYEDVSGRKYEQQFGMVFDENGEGIIKNYAIPKLLEV
jgi:hypothetical protein